MKTQAKISVETKVSGDDTIYFVKSKKNKFEVICKEDGSFLINTSAKTLSSAVGGRGEDDGKDAYFTDKHCKNNSDIASTILELLVAISK